jgi:hypothetical protein
MGVALLTLIGMSLGLLPGCGADTTVLTADEDWELAVVARPAGGDGPGLQLRQERATSVSTQVASGYDRPARLDSATSFSVRRDGELTTLVAGPVDDDAVEVRVESAAGDRAEATLDAARGLTWFWAEVPGSQQIAAITAHDADGTLLDEYTLPPMPPPQPLGGG